MGATRGDKEAWEAQYKLNEAGRLFPMVIELVNEALIHYEHVCNDEMVDECDGLQGLFIPLTEKFAEANRKALGSHLCPDHWSERSDDLVQKDQTVLKQFFDLKVDHE